MARRITLADVAARSGASKATVSLVLNNKEARISLETIQRVKQAAQELGYSPNQAAQTLRTGRTNTLAFISDEVLTTRFASAMTHGILEVAERHDQMILMAETEHEQARWAKALESMKSRQVDGYILGLMRARDLAAADLPTSHPAVVVNGRARGIPSILPHEYRAGQAAVRHLLSAGHQHIALIGRPQDLTLDPGTMNIPRRMAGIDQALDSAGLALVDEYRETIWESDTGYLGASTILGRTPHVTAFIAANDRIAFGIYRALQERNLHVAEDISVISFDDEELASYMHPGLTTVRLPYAEMGQVATQVLLQESPQELIDGIEAKGNELLIPMPLMERHSVARPPHNP
ncbi:LacI family DNA-binding transcriptional regulator [Rothia nasisuis]|uniref:LacI family DNA-binding transcriptional regulator n=1 Tax=Rothia nasisuis TaxID=2109647 RepID=UPI001F25E7F8|nr:LacI family DNA-binding transcriptional regulator [Rothia nasisuis]